MVTKNEAALNGADVLSLAAERAMRYVNEVRQRKVAPEQRDIQSLEQFRETFPEGPSDPKSVVAMLDELGSPATGASAGGRYFGFVIGGAVPAAVGANWLGGGGDSGCALRERSPIEADLAAVGQQ